MPLIIAWALLGVGPGPLQYAQANGDSGGVQHIVVTLYKSRTLVLPKPFASVVVGSPELVDALPMSDRRLYIQGKKIGTTNVSVFNQSMQLAGVIDVEVTPDTGNLQEKIRSSTGSSAIRVGSSNGQIVLSGLASNSVAADRAVEVAKTMVPEGNIVNAMKVAPSQQVMLRVRFLEVARTASREIGVNWFGANNAGNRGFTTGLGTASAGGRPASGPSETLQDLAGCRTPPCVDASGNPVPAPGRPLAAGHRAFRYSILWGLCSLRSLVRLRCLLASRWPVSPPRGAASTLLCPHWKPRASSDAWPSRTWLHSPVTPPPSWRAANFRCRRRKRAELAACQSSPPNSSPSA